MEATAPQKSGPSASGTGLLTAAKNWPPCCPLVHHDIAGDIPAAQTGMVRCAYWAYMGLLLCLFWNFLGTAAATIGVGGDHLSSLLWAAIYVLGGVPGALILWYMRLYNAAIKDSAFQYAFFFCWFGIAHLVFCGWSAVAPPILNTYSHTGFWAARRMILANVGTGIIYYVGSALWAVEFLWSFWTLRVAYGSFRGKGMVANQVKTEAKQGAVTLVATAV